MLKLQFKDQRKPAIWLVEARYAIGNDPQNKIVLTDEGVSAFHAEIRVEGDQVFISDTGSSNGTFVNGKRIARRTELRSADMIAIHNVQFLLIDPKQEISGAPEGATAISPALANIPIATQTPNKQGSGWMLKAKTGSIVGKSFPVSATGKMIIGRANNCDIQLPANHVSRQHAEVQVVGGRLLVKDLNSSNGTYINRKKVANGELKHGDEVRFDTFSFEVTGPTGLAPSKVVALDEEGEEHTQFRGSVATGTRPKTDMPAAAVPAAKPVKPASTTAATKLQPKMDTAVQNESGSGGGMMGVGILVVVVAAAAAWFFLK
ncbi:MAG: FHA domain-containing protein [Pseudomonadota bacterium]